MSRDRAQPLWSGRRELESSWTRSTFPKRQPRDETPDAGPSSMKLNHNSQATSGGRGWAGLADTPNLTTFTPTDPPPYLDHSLHNGRAATAADLQTLGPGQVAAWRLSGMLLFVAIPAQLQPQDRNIKANHDQPQLIDNDPYASLPFHSYSHFQPRIIPLLRALNSQVQLVT